MAKRLSMKSSVAVLAHEAKRLGYAGQDHTKSVLLRYINENTDDPNGVTVSPGDDAAIVDGDSAVDREEQSITSEEVGSVEVSIPTPDNGGSTDQDTDNTDLTAPDSPVTLTEQALEEKRPPEIFPKYEGSLLNKVEDSFPTVAEFVRDVADMVTKRDNNMEDISWTQLYDVALRVMRDCRAHDEVSVNAVIRVHTSGHSRRFSTVVRRVIATEFLPPEERQLRHDLWDCTIRLMRTKDYSYIDRMFQEIKEIEN